MAILWLVSFPKSGNTWMRAFLANYFANGQEPMSLAQLQEFGFSDAHGWPYEKLTGRPHQTLSDEELGQLRPKVQEMMARSQRDNAILKSHFPVFDTGDVPSINRRVALGAIYIIRNPWDVAISYADHAGMSLDEAIDAIAQPSLAIESDSQNIRQFLGGWSGHVKSWNNVEGLPLHIVRYEDMAAKPQETFAKAVAFLNLPAERQRLRKAIKFSSFRELSRQEARNGFAEKSQNAERFFRKGRAGGWRSIMTEDQVQRVLEDHREALTHFGYVNPDGSIAVTKPA